MTKVKLILFGLLLLTILGLGHEVALGAVAQWGSHNYDALLVLPPSYPPRQQLAAFMVDKQESLPFQVGRVVGSTATILQGITEIADGTRRIQVGVLVSAENVGIGGAVAVSGVTEGVHGAVVVSQGVRGWVESGGQILKMAGKGGGGGANKPLTIGTQKGPLLTSQNKGDTKLYVQQNWYKGTFDTELDSAAYHLNKHGYGATIQQYTQQAQDFYKSNWKSAELFQQAGMDLYRIKNLNGYGVFTSDGRVVTFEPY